MYGVVESLRECFTTGEGIGLERATLCKAVCPFSLLLLSVDRPKPNVLLNAECALGVRGVVGGVLRLGDVRAGVACLVTGVETFLRTLIGLTEALVGDWLGLGDAILLLDFAGVDGVISICVIRFTLTAEALEGRGLIGRDDFSSDEGGSSFAPS